MAVGAGQPNVEFRLGWSGLIAQAAESMGARLVIDELSRIASDGRLPSAATRSRATAARAQNEILKKGSQTRSGGLRSFQMYEGSLPLLLRDPVLRPRNRVLQTL